MLLACLVIPSSNVALAQLYKYHHQRGKHQVSLKAPRVQLFGSVKRTLYIISVIGAYVSKRSQMRYKRGVTLSLDESAVVLHWCELCTNKQKYLILIFCSIFDHDAYMKSRRIYELFITTSLK